MLMATDLAFVRFRMPKLAIRGITRVRRQQLDDTAEDIPTDQPAGKCIVGLLLWAKRTG